MNKEIVKTSWLNNMAFEGEVNGHRILVDAGTHAGGENRGARPKSLMLLALGGCTGMDVISILTKMKVHFEKFSVYVEGELTDEYPKHFNKMHVIYEFTGKNLPPDKLKRAVELSEDKYCGVSAVYKKVIEMTSEIKVIET